MINHLKHLFLFTFSVFFSIQHVQAQSTPDRLRVLFLGDSGHHEPGKRVLQILPYMAERGIQVVYTEDVSELNSQRLSQFHVLMLYGNTPSISKEQELAMLNFVQGGGGLVPVHAGIAMFANSDAYHNLAGGTFKSHGAGTFTTRFVAPNHPVLEGLSPFESWDETYVHQKHNPDKTVLSVREENGHSEPWTWVRDHGKGRVFYTAWGHDERTWEQSGFHQLLERGLRWAAGDWALSSNWSPPRLNYEEGIMPYYPAGEGWGVTGEPFSSVQKPLSPEASMQQTFVEPGFEMQLFAAEPDVINPIDMTWDERGRLWVLETVDYPNRLNEDGNGEDRIKILEDTNGDGRADKISIFAEGLNIPTSLVLANGGVIVAQAPHFVFYKDTNGDDKADEKEILFSGWGTRDTHAGPNNLRYGLDNQIWGAVGYSSFSGSVGSTDSVRFGQALFRFASDASSIEHMATFNNNTWGLSFSEEGFVFGSTANGHPSMFSAIPERFYSRLNDGAAHVLRTIADHPQFFPISSHVRQVDWHGLYTAGSAYEVYTARLFPQKYWNRYGFIGGPTGHLMGYFEHHADGSGFKATNKGSFIASRDDWFSPIQIKVGPEGALWFVDWYNPIIQHNPTPPGYEQGEGNAYVNPLRDKKHSRIYRVVPTDRPLPTTMSLAGASQDELIEALSSDNMFWRLTAQRLLVEAGDESAASALINMVLDESIDDLGLNPGAIHALWTLKGLGLMEEGDHEAVAAARQALHHPSTGVQRNAIQVLPRTEATFEALLQAGFLPDPTVPAEMTYTVPFNLMDAAAAPLKLESLLAVAEMEPMEEAGKAIARFVSVKEHAGDAHLVTAAAVAARQHATGFVDTLIGLNPDPAGDSVYTAALSEMLVGAASILSAQTAPAIPGVVFQMDETHESLQQAVMAGILAGWPAETRASWTEAERLKFISMYENAPSSLEELFRSLRQRWE